MRRPGRPDRPGSVALGCREIGVPNWTFGTFSGIPTFLLDKWERWEDDGPMNEPATAYETLSGRLIVATYGPMLGSSGGRQLAGMLANNDRRN